MAFVLDCSVTMAWVFPACTGEPPARMRQVETRKKVYPRVCGGTAIAPSIDIPVTGLSPRVRGNRTLARAHLASQRSIPACAGEPREKREADGRSWVYPRVCGGTSRLYRLGRAVSGLSPRVRGNRTAKAPTFGRLGSIPACAGEPCLQCVTGSPGKVYPRVCGGTLTCPSSGMTTSGLSPRVRGNRSRPAGCVERFRSIPACAGEPGA